MKWVLFLSPLYKFYKWGHLGTKNLRATDSFFFFFPRATDSWKVEMRSMLRKAYAWANGLNSYATHASKDGNQ